MLTSQCLTSPPNPLSSSGVNKNNTERFQPYPEITYNARRLREQGISSPYLTTGQPPTSESLHAEIGSKQSYSSPDISTQEKGAIPGNEVHDGKPGRHVKRLQSFHSWPGQESQFDNRSILSDLLSTSIPPESTSAEQITPTITTESVQIQCSDDKDIKQREVLAESERPANRRSYDDTLEKGAGIYNWVKKDNFSQVVEHLEYRVYTDNAVVNKKLETQRAEAEKQQKTQPQKQFIRPESQRYNAEFQTLAKDHGKVELGNSYLMDRYDNQKTEPYMVCSEYSQEDTATGVAWSIGRRFEMEDSHQVSSFEINFAHTQYPVKVACVFDGHGGPEFAEYARDNIEDRLAFYLKKFNRNGLSNAGIMSALKILMVDLDGGQKDKTPSKIEGLLDRRGGDKTDNPGTTASVAVLINNELWISGVGDCRALLVSENGETQQVSCDIKPKTVIQKVKNRGGLIMMGRLAGVLSTGTAIGDHNLASVSSRPKVTRYTADEFPGKILVQVCDGVTDVASSNEIGQAAAQYAKEGDSEAKIAGKIVAQAYAAGSGDNLSCMVTTFKPLARARPEP